MRFCPNYVDWTATPPKLRGIGLPPLRHKKLKHINNNKLQRMKKTIYEAPIVEQINVKVEDNFLATTESVESARRVVGTWDEE